MNTFKPEVLQLARQSRLPLGREVRSGTFLVAFKPLDLDGIRKK
jgi:hypothetical protein